MSTLTYDNTFTSAFPNMQYYCQMSGRGPDDKNGRIYDKDEQESFEIEEEIKHVEKLIDLVVDAVELDKKLPSSQREKNSHLNDLRKDPHVKEFFDGKDPSIDEIPELHRALLDAKEEKQEELAAAKNNSKDESFTNSVTDSSNSLRDSSNSLKDPFHSSFYKSDNTSDNKKDDDNNSEFKLLPNLLLLILEIIRDIFS